MCEKNGIVFKKADGETIKCDYINVIDDNGEVVKLTKDNGLFELFPWLKTKNTKREFDRVQMADKEWDSTISELRKFEKE